MALYLVGGFFLAAAFHWAHPPASALEQPLQVPGFPAAREFLFALGFLAVVLLLTEPISGAQESQKVEFPFRLRLPAGAGPSPQESPNANPSIMNQLNQLTY